MLFSQKFSPLELSQALDQAGLGPLRWGLDPF